ncbi:hypothetical protein SCUCBS95973_005584 [Sporothrix curviconia]|uniref:Uncharacterized protein n=1 Tax=Sporothrix curviconia TaxID=1260050 RepID=A0ABP0BZX2_9PEZI
MSSFTVDEMKEVHKRLSDIIADASQELADLQGMSAFVGGLDLDGEDQQLLVDAAASARGRRNMGTAAKTAAETKAECERLYAEVQSKMGRAWMKKYDLQVQKRALDAEAKA